MTDKATGIVWDNGVKKFSLSDTATDWIDEISLTGSTTTGTFTYNPSFYSIPSIPTLKEQVASFGAYIDHMIEQLDELNTSEQNFGKLKDQE